MTPAEQVLPPHVKFTSADYFYASLGDVPGRSLEAPTEALDLQHVWLLGGALAVLGLLEDVIHDLGDVAGKVIERSHHLGSVCLDDVHPVAEPGDFLAQHLVLALERLITL